MSYTGTAQYGQNYRGSSHYVQTYRGYFRKGNFRGMWQTLMKITLGQTKKRL